MAQIQSILLAPLPRSLRLIGIPIAAFVLTTFFVLLGFPYQHLTSRATAMASQALEVEIEAASSGLTLGLAGPGFRFEGLRVETPTGDVYSIDDVRFGAAWALSWFVLEPTLFVDVDSRLGKANGTIRIGDVSGWEGSFSAVQLSEIPFLESLLPVQLTGTLDADGSLHSVDGNYVGPLDFEIRQGVVAHPALALDLPFETLGGAMVFGGEAMVTIESFSLVGPMLEFDALGTIGNGTSFDQRALDLDLRLTDLKPEVSMLVESFGITATADGTASFHIGGTGGAPDVK